MCLSVSVVFSQQAPQELKATPNSPDQAQIDATLQRYLAAYQHKSIQELLAVWPDLQQQKKEYNKIKRQFEDGNISDEQVSLQPVQTQSDADGAVVRAHRTEQFVKTERSSSSTTGDLRAGGMPGQDPGPYQSEKKKTFKKSSTVSIKLHRAGDNWTIVSIAEEKS
ncbi:MAG: hypothetical protein JWQ87_3606 [Candidatus Sulfotelmatobacter sp.]|nr:hypothetical protein [Candidatus Sulfotelmatobacter sp.]